MVSYETNIIVPLKNRRKIDFFAYPKTTKKTTFWEEIRVARDHFSDLRQHHFWTSVSTIFWTSVSTIFGPSIPDISLPKNELGYVKKRSAELQKRQKSEPPGLEFLSENSRQNTKVRTAYFLKTYYKITEN